MIIAAVLAIPFVAATKDGKKVLLDRSGILPGWQVVADERTAVEPVAEGYLLKNFGTTNFVYTEVFGYRDYDRLLLVLQNSAPLQLRIIPDITTTANYTFENELAIPASASPRTYQFSLRYPNFRQINNFGIKFITAESAEILIQEISLEKASLWQNLGQAARDYFHAAPYSPFTVNVLATPRIFGRSAFVYFLPVFLGLAGLLFSRRFRRGALWGLLALWLLTDFRMGYEFLRYQMADYQTWVKPPASQKVLRSYGNFYAFLDWLSKNLPAETAAVNFYSSDTAHFPRLAQYYLYPIRVFPESREMGAVYVIYQKPASPLPEEGRVIASFDEQSFIFVSP